MPNEQCHSELTCVIKYCPDANAIAENALRSNASLFKDAEFYMNDLDLTVNGKDGIEKLVGNAFQIKESLELSIQYHNFEKNMFPK